MQTCIRQHVCSDLIRETKICTKYVDAFQWPWRRYTSVYLKVGPSLCISTCWNYRGVSPQHWIETQRQVDVTDGLMSAAVQSYLPFYIGFLQCTNVKIWNMSYVTSLHAGEMSKIARRDDSPNEIFARRVYLLGMTLHRLYPTSLWSFT